MLTFDEGPGCDLTSWEFDFDGVEGVLDPDFVKSMLAQISEVVDAEVRKRSGVMLWSQSDEDGQPLDPTVAVNIPLGEDDCNDMQAWAPLLDLVKDCIECNVPDQIALTAWGDYFKRCADMFYAAATDSRNGSTP